MRHIPGDEVDDRSTTQFDERSTTQFDERSTPFEPVVVSTEAYLVGDERPYNPNDQSEIIERYLRNERHRSPVDVDKEAERNYQQQEDVRLVKI